MIDAYLIRDDIHSDSIRGRLIVDGEMFVTIERPWLHNRRNASCIPKGRYPATYLPRSSSGKFRNIYWLNHVPMRSGILIHVGNVVAQSHGCILIGKRIGSIGGERAVLNSRTAMHELISLLDRKSFTLHVFGGYT